MGTELVKFIENTSALPPENIKSLFSMLAKSHKETELTKRELKKYESMKDVMIQEITGKYKFYEYFFSRVFAERSAAIKKDFDIIDRGMKENNRDFISAGVSGLSQIVASSPFTDMEKLKKMIENTEGEFPNRATRI